MNDRVRIITISLKIYELYILVRRYIDISFIITFKM